MSRLVRLRVGGDVVVVVVANRYRAPELLLGAKEYSWEIDMWAVGCIFAEMLCKEPLMKAQTELQMIDQIFKMLGTPNDDVWPGFSELPFVKKMKFKVPSPLPSTRPPPAPTSVDDRRSVIIDRPLDSRQSCCRRTRRRYGKGCSRPPPTRGSIC